MTFTKLIFRILPVISIFISACGHDLPQTMPTNDEFVWQPVGFDSTSILGLTTDRNGGLIAATRSGAIFRSTDNGDTWMRQGSNYLGAMAVLAANRNGDIYAAPSRGLYTPLFRSTDNGQTWQQISLPFSLWILDTDFNTRGDIFIAAIAEAAPRSWLYCSTDNGQSWDEIPVPVPSGHFLDVEIAASGYLYLATERGIYRSGDDGKTWQSLSPGFPAGVTWQIAAGRSGTVYASNLDGVWRSYDHGLSWSRTRLDKNCMTVLAVSPGGGILAGGKMFCSVPEGLYFSEDRGEHWSHLNVGLPTKVLSALAVTEAGDIFVGISSHGLFRNKISENR